MSTVRCDLCPKNCALGPGEMGLCRTRYNQAGVLRAVTYGRPAAVHKDPIEKKPLFHFLPGTRTFSLATTGCNLRCKNCQNAGLSQANPLDRRAHVASPKRVVALAQATGCASVALTYSDPVVFYEYALDIGAAAHKEGMRVVWVTAGYINRAPLLRAIPHMDAVNLDIKALSDEFYRDNCGATLRPVLETARLLKKEDIWLEITNLVIPGLNDKDEHLRALSRFVKKELGRETPVHFSRFFPHHRLRNIPRTPESTLLRARELARAEGLSNVYLGNLRHRKGLEDTRCPSCGETVIERYGYTIIKNSLVEGRCPKCKTPLSGIWSTS